MVDEVEVVSIDMESKVIKFKKIPSSSCEHKLVEINESLNLITCLDCKQGLNPIKWLSKYIGYLNHATQYNNEVLAKCRAIESNVKSITRVICGHCKKENQIQVAHPSPDELKKHLKIVEDEMLQQDAFSFYNPSVENKE